MRLVDVLLSLHVILTSYACAELTKTFCMSSVSNENFSFGPIPSPLIFRGRRLSLPVTSQYATVEWLKEINGIL